MKVGFVGTVTVFRQIDVKGIRVGQIDVIQHGDYKYPTKTYTINIVDQAYARVLLTVMEQTPTPLIRAILWLESVKGEMEITLLQLVSVDDSLLTPAFEQTLEQEAVEAS